MADEVYFCSVSIGDLRGCSCKEHMLLAALKPAVVFCFIVKNKLQRTYAACGIETFKRQCSFMKITELQRTYAACGIETPDI